MLPYFTYDVPEERKEELFAKPEEFLDQTKWALEYYSKLFEHDKIFDQVYVTGWDPLSKLKNFNMGGNLQNNPPLFSELYASLGALKFFASENKISDNQEIFHIGKNDSNEILWSDIPKVSNSLNSKENIANKTEIKIGIRDGGFIEVVSGLKEGDNIVAEGLKKVRPKGKIKPIKK